MYLSKFILTKQKRFAKFPSIYLQSPPPWSWGWVLNCGCCKFQAGLPEKQLSQANAQFESS